MRGINFPLVIGFTMLFVLLTSVSLLFAFGKDEGTLGEGFAKNLVADSFYVFRFPTHTIFWQFFSSSGGLYLAGLTLNCLFYGFLVERIIRLVNKYVNRR